jgi:hypothetical protein
VTVTVNDNHHLAASRVVLTLAMLLLAGAAACAAGGWIYLAFLLNAPSALFRSISGPSTFLGMLESAVNNTPRQLTYLALVVNLLAIAQLVGGVALLVNGRRKRSPRFIVAWIEAGIAARLTTVMIALSLFVHAMLAGFGLSSLARARIVVNEILAIESVRELWLAQSLFRASCGGGYYAPAPGRLLTPPPGAGYGFLSSWRDDLGTNPSSGHGYIIRMTPGDTAKVAVDCHGSTVVRGYFVSAEPIVAGVSGRRFFAANQSLSTHSSTSPIAPTFDDVFPRAMPVADP